MRTAQRNRETNRAPEETAAAIPAPEPRSVLEHSVRVIKSCHPVPIRMKSQELAPL